MTLKGKVTLSDLESLDTDLSSNMTWILEDTLTDLIPKTVIEYCILHWVHEPFDTSMSGFGGLIPRGHSNIFYKHLPRNGYPRREGSNDMAQPPPLAGLIQWNSCLVPDPTDSRDTTGGDLPRPYEIGPKWKFKFGNSSQDDVHDTKSTHQSSKVA
ncbi:hypothetical protein BS47DRAFT_1401394 [Hydnum rufescens UP504]|uniref:Uncharacterized protein n=1 Tax=Hydnum rufescens UP504 TaxID=1448309 RepID=A0A9P6AET9_9AGAM|nr:hypothetical protein BS47DRAFT_1401394 [Hydnum rufescens UP504]